MRRKHNAQLANFDVTSFACYLGPLSTAAAHLEKAIKLPWRVSSPKDSSSACENGCANVQPDGRRSSASKCRK